MGSPSAQGAPEEEPGGDRGAESRERTLAHDSAHAPVGTRQIFSEVIDIYLFVHSNRPLDP